MEDREFEELELNDLDDFNDLNEIKKPEMENEQRQHQDPFTALMFGTRRQPPLRSIQHSQQEKHPAYTQNIDYEAIMVNIDKLIESVRGFKPLFQQIYPHIKKLWNK